MTAIADAHPMITTAPVDIPRDDGHAMRDPIPVEAFLERSAPDMRELAERLRGLLHETIPDATERVRPGWGIIGYDLPNGRKTTFFAWVWPEAVHVHLGFVRGVLMDDPGRLLDGGGVTKQARWLTFRPGDDIDPRWLAPLIREAARIARLSLAERYAAEQEIAARTEPELEPVD